MNKLSEYLKKLFSHGSTMESSENKNPWVGLSSYDDPGKRSRKVLFTGREKESFEIFNLIDDNLLVTLYGKSGIGKTSLLNAGVFPLLRKDGYSPLYIRLVLNEQDKQNSDNLTFAEKVIQAIKENKTYIGSGLNKQDNPNKQNNDSLTFAEKVIQTIKENITTISTIDSIPENIDSTSDSYLWSFFARHRFYNENGEIIFPVIVFDQFEDAIRLSGDKSSLLLEQIAYMLDKTNAISDFKTEDGEVYTYDYNFRFIISIREDDLYRLEDVINQLYLPSLKQCRYRLQNLSKKSAEDIITINGANCIDEKDRDEICNLIIKASVGEEDNLISTNTLSLICSRLYDIVTGKNHKIITLKDVKHYLSNNPFKEYYSNAVQDLSGKEKYFIEECLVTSDGRRALISEKKLSSAIKSYEKLINGKTKLLHYVKSTADTENKVELIHDGICPIIQDFKEIRIEKKNGIIYALCLFILLMLSLWLLNVSFVDNFAKLFLTLNNPSEGITHVDFNMFLAIAQLVGVILYPPVIGSIVYGLKWRKYISCGLLFCYLLPIILFPNALHEVLQECTTFELSTLVEGQTGPFLLYTVATLSLCIYGFLGRNNYEEIIRNVNVISNNLSTWLFYFVISAFLFYKSLFNIGNGAFVAETSDSCWGLVVLPIIGLFMFGFNITYIRKKLYPFIFYVIILIAIAIAACFMFEERIILISALSLLAFCDLLLIFYKGNLVSSLLRSVVNEVVLVAALILNLGYNPNVINSNSVEKVYPWKTVICKDDGKFGVIDANNGDTLLIPVFDSYNQMLFSKVLSSNNYLDTITCKNIGKEGIIQLAKGNGEWILSTKRIPNIDYTLASMMKPISKRDSINKLVKSAAFLFFNLRNRIVEFCISGNETKLLNEIEAIKKYENVLKFDLKKSLYELERDSMMTETDIVPVIRCLTKNIYMNMLKESILKKQYNNLVNWFTQYYLAVNFMLPGVKIPGCNFGLGNNKMGGNQIATGNSANEINTWNLLFNKFILLEISAHSKSYNSTYQFSDGSNDFKTLLKKTSELRNSLSGLKSKLLDCNSQLDNIIKNLKNDRGKNRVNAETRLLSLINTLKIKNNIVNDLKSNKKLYDQITDISGSIISQELTQADKEFDEFAYTSIEALKKIISKNPFNLYNGALVAICDNLYAIGVCRGYDMNKYKKAIAGLDNYRKLSFLEKTEQNNRIIQEYNNKAKESESQSNLLKELLNNIK